MFSVLQFGVVILIAYAGFIGAVWALVNAASAPAGAFVSAGKQSKTLWVVLTAAASAIQFVFLPFPFGTGSGPLNFLGIAGIAVAIIYHVGVKPAIAPYRGQRGPRGGNSRNTGGW